jgi:hydroxymethylglutaryl-CoA lyase
MMKFPKEITIVEVGPRDGFQNIKTWIPTELKLQILEQLILSGFKKIEVTSFVHPKVIPQMKDAKEIVQYLIEKHKGKTIFNALVPNSFGAKSAYEAGIDEITYVISASEAHNKANINRTHEESLLDLKGIIEAFPSLPLKVDFATVFGCPFNGKTPIENVIKLLEGVLEMKKVDFCLCDTIGVANPLQIKEVIQTLKGRYKDINFSLHLHDTRGMGMANSLMAMGLGIDTFETALGGLGGCPFAPGASGNVATEDFVNMAEEMGVKTNINLSTLLKAVNIVKENVENNLTGHLINVKNCQG